MQRGRRRKNVKRIERGNEDERGGGRVEYRKRRRTYMKRAKTEEE